MNFDLSPPTSADLPALSALCLRSKGHWGYSSDFLDACRTELTLTKRDLAETEMLMAKHDDAYAGLVQVTRDQAPADLLKLFIDPPFIGTGLGRTFFDWAVAEARSQGCAAMMIDADPDAAPFYQAMGADLVGEIPSGSIPGRILPLLRFTL